ncbi:putative alpha/beta superfamily hydrolase [Luteibacter sp. HA06]
MKLLTLAALAAMGLSTAAHATDAHEYQGPDMAAQATTDYTRSFDFVSKFNDESYRVKVYIPQGKAPAGGYPAVYLLDGSTMFGTFASAVWNEAQAQEREQAVVVGIEAGPGKNDADRTFDFTPSDMSETEKKIVVDLGPKPRFGGYENFMRTIQEEVKPRVQKLVALDRKHETLFGWSLGGQVVVHTMLVHPEFFSCYVALSPSIWRNDRAVLKEIPAFEQKVANGTRVSLFVGVGSLEEELSAGMAKWPVDQGRLREEARYAHMVGNVVDFTALMRPLFQDHGMAFESRIFEGETHNTVSWTAVNPVLQFVLPPGHPK